MKTVCKKLLSLMLVAVLLVSVVPFQAFAAEVTDAPATETTTATEPTETTAAATEPVAQASAEEETTAPETTAATEAPTVDQNVAQQPAGNTLGDTGVTVQYVVQVNGEDAVVKEYTNQVAGARFPAPPSAAAVLQVYGQYAGTSQGKKFQQWEDANGGYFDYSKHYIEAANTDGSVVTIYAKVIDASQNIVLITNGGTLSSVYYPVIIGETYGALPTPTRAHYTFQYWYKTVNGVEVPVNGETIVEDTSSLTAKWELNKYVVNYQRFAVGGADENGWEDSGFGAVVDANSVVSVAKGTFPTDAQIQTYFALPGYKIVGWEIGTTDTAFTAGYTRITDNMIVRPRYQRTVTLKAANPVTKVSWSTKSITVEIGEPFGAIEKTLPNPGARDSYTFNAWIIGDAGKIEVKDLSNPASHPLYYDALGTVFEAEFVPAQFVYLHIHTDGNTKTAAKIVPYYLAPANGIFDMTLINMYSIFPSYGDYDDTVDYAHGWFNDAQWERYCTGKSADNAMYYEELVEQVEANGNNFYIMLYNGGTSSSNSSSNGNSYNNNSSTADKTNPTTGDQIFMAVTVMAMSASALALFFFLKKRKAC